MAFKDLAEFAKKAKLELPINGKTYVVPDVSSETGTWAQLLANRSAAASTDSGREVDVAELLLSDEEERNLYQRMLGDAYAEMIADDVGWSWVKHAGITALMWVTNGEKAAEEHWLSYDEASGEVEARTPNRASRRASEAVARTTKSPARGSGTRASKASTATARPGRASSKPGPL